MAIMIRIAVGLKQTAKVHPDPTRTRRARARVVERRARDAPPEKPRHAALGVSVEPVPEESSRVAQDRREEYRPEQAAWGDRPTVGDRDHPANA